MSLLSVVQSVTAVLSLPSPASVINSTDPNVIMLFALANEEGADLASSFDWQSLTEQYIFTTSATPQQSGALPPDLDRIVPDSLWNRTTDRPMIGPVSPQKWQQLQAFPNVTLPCLCFRERQGQVLVYPTPPAGQTIAYEYVSANWCMSASSSASIPVYGADGDTAYLDERLITLGVRWRFLKSRGLDYAEDFRTYESQKAQAQARDGGSTALAISGEAISLVSQIPEGGFPGPT